MEFSHIDCYFMLYRIICKIPAARLPKVISSIIWKMDMIKLLLVTICYLIVLILDVFPVFLLHHKSGDPPMEKRERFST